MTKTIRVENKSVVARGEGYREGFPLKGQHEGGSFLE